MKESDMSPAFREAWNILGMEPIPENASKRLEELEKQIRPDEQDRFGDLWEALMASSDVLPEEISKTG